MTRIIILLATVLTTQSLLAKHNIEATVGIETVVVDLVNERAKRPIKVTLWYPSGDCKTDTTKYCLSKTASLDQVIVFSHGSMGSPNGYTWLLTELAKAGYIVAGFSHYGESRDFGEASTDVSSVGRFWQRAEDISVGIDALADMRIFEEEVSWLRLILAGHSAGGQTAASLAGAIAKPQLIVEYCQSVAVSNDRGCAYRKNAPDIESLPEGYITSFTASYKDPRVTALIMLDPALGPAMESESLAKIDVPTLIVGAKDNDFIPYENHASRYAEHIPNSKLVGLGNNAGHFIFLNKCTHPYKAMGVSLCEDRPGADRVAEQAIVVGLVMEFLVE